MLGNRTNLAEAQAKGQAANAAAADAHARNVLPLMRDIMKADASLNLRGIAAALNARGIRTARGGAWHGTTVRNVLRRDEGAT